MGFKSKYHIDVDFEVPKKINWYYAPAFAVFWLILYLAVVTTQVNRLPKALNRRDERKNPDTFIAERAEEILINLARIGPKVVGSEANEVTAVQFLLDEISKVQEQASDYFEFEIDVQIASGNYIHWSLINMYQGVQNVIVKLSAKNTTNENYLLMNSHFDSVPGSPGASDDGAMVCVMLEVMRIISKSSDPLEHPIIFLFNGAEENPLQASHAFITQHKWAKNCKALINLDSAGSGGREILFQSGPNHPWLMKYYRQVPHPFASTTAEEIFQANLIPSDTDFRIFRDFGGVPGLDMAYIFNGYVYHTEFDRVNIFPKSSLQNTGNNVLVLAKSIANAPEMDNTTLYQEGHVIFYDYLGWFIVFYSETTGIIVNIVVCICGLIAIGVSIFFMSARSGLRWHAVMRRYAIIFAIQIMSLILGAGLSLLIALFMDGVGRSMTWFSQNWLIIGLYFCPVFFGLGLLPALYFERTKQDSLSLGFRIQLLLHSHCLLLIILTLVLTSIGIRSAYMYMMAVFFDIAALIINLLTKWHRRAYWFAITVIICQIIPFLFYTYIILGAYHTMIPMMGRSGSDVNPDLSIAVMAVFMSILIGGFIMPLFMFFRKTRTIILCFLAATVICIIIAITPVGFPYRPKTATQRYSLIHSHRILHGADNTTKIEENGILVYPQDRRIDSANKYIELIGEKHTVDEFCGDEMFCGMPIYNHRWHKARDRSFWIVINEAPIIPGEYPKLILNSITELDDVPNRQRFDFTLSGPDHMTIFVRNQNDAKLLNWSFNDTMLREKWEQPYFIYFSYGKDDSPLRFYIDIEKTAEKFNLPGLEIGIGGHWIHQQEVRSSKFEQIVQTIPDYWSVSDWVATYENWLY